ncbi:hypothetical protein Ddye_022431 [Dipteronia dyeriana]|uniref:Uncharacterized protein n=1 Tax=Dipteronia dyeriana TaxID=168575 RepID=A0AAD9WXU2_9ROSI|nr:hypothetical protein Ddye_022431 [Dipteronia dyeriana]
MVLVFQLVVAEFISLSMPTIAAVNGHAAAGGCALALCHDYVIMRRDRGVMYMSEVDLGLTFPCYLSALFRAKFVGSAQALRDVMLRGAKIRGEEAVRMGIVDSAAHDSEEEVAEASVRLGEQLAFRKWNGQVYAEMRKSLYPDLCGLLGLVQNGVANSKL